jgi:hypothetical protein
MAWVPRKTERQAEVRALRAEGRSAHQAGQSILDNPHQHCDADQWERGFMQAYVEAAGLKRRDGVALEQARLRAIAAARKATRNKRREP